MHNFAGGSARAFEIRNFRLFWTGQLVNNLAVWINRAGVQWLAWELTHSFAWLGVIGAASMVPTLIFGPIAGTAADRYGHRRQLLSAAAISAGVAYTMGAVTLAGLINAETLLALAAMGGTTRVFTVPARNALVHSLVERRHLSAAIGVNAATYQGTIFVGAALGGGVILVAGSGAAFLIHGCGILFAFIMVSVLVIPPFQRTSGNRDRFFTEHGAGFTYAHGHPGIRMMLLISALMAADRATLSGDALGLCQRGVRRRTRRFIR
jgi:MFS family permease